MPQLLPPVSIKLNSPLIELVGPLIDCLIEQSLKISSVLTDSDTLERLTGRLAGSCVSSCVLGLKRSFSDPEFAENVAVIEEGFHVGEKLAPFEVLPILKRVQPGWWRRVQEKMQKNHCRTCGYFKGLIREKVTGSRDENAGSTAGPAQGDDNVLGCQSSSASDSLITIYRREMAKPEVQEKQILSGKQFAAIPVAIKGRVEDGQTADSLKVKEMIIVQSYSFTYAVHVFL